MLFAMKIFINSIGHMIKMTPSPLYGKQTLQIVPVRTISLMTLNFGIEYWKLKLYKLYINDDP